VLLPNHPITPLLQFSEPSSMRHPSLILLSHDHHHGLALALRCRKQALGQLKPMGATGLRERAKECLEFHANHLIAHFRAEEEVLFPAVRGIAPGSDVIVDDLLSQHQEIRRLMSQLEGGAGLAKLIFDLGDLLERHIRKEERELFKLFEDHVEGAKAEAIGAELKKILETPSS